MSILRKAWCWLYGACHGRDQAKNLLASRIQLENALRRNQSNQQKVLRSVESGNVQTRNALILAQEALGILNKAKELPDDEI